MGAIVTVIVMGDALEHTTITGGVSVVTVNCDMLKNTLPRKNIHYINFL